MNLEKEKNQAYWERNQLVCYLSKFFPAWLERHPDEDEDWEDKWRNIVFIHFPAGKYSWHIHNDELKYFYHLSFKSGNSWDGSTTEEKYKSLNPDVYDEIVPVETAKPIGGYHFKKCGLCDDCIKELSKPKEGAGACYTICKDCSMLEVMEYLKNNE